MAKSKFESIQILRGVAAISVLITHAILRSAESFPEQAKHSFLLNFHHLARLGAAGVDIFFVISGFIMMYTHFEKFGQPGSVKHFIVRRTIRILPLYWSITLVTLSLHFANATSFHHQHVDWRWVLGSLFFLQLTGNGNQITPIVGQGWTLYFEMFFYAIFAVALLLPRRRAVPLMFSLLWIFILVGKLPIVAPSWFIVWTNPLLTEFMAGVLLALAMQHKLPIFSKSLGYLLIVSGGVLFVLTMIVGEPGMLSWQRPFLWGMPAVLVVWGTLTLQKSETRIGSIGILLGDASYSIYLFHLFPLLGLLAILRKIPCSNILPLDVIILLLTICSIAVCTATWRLFEKPVTDSLNERFRSYERSRLNRSAA